MARSEALAKLAKEVVSTHKVVLRAAELVSSNQVHKDKIPETFGISEPKAAVKKSPVKIEKSALQDIKDDPDFVSGNKVPKVS